VDRLRDGGVDVVDDGDVEGEVFTADPTDGQHRSIAAVVRVARSVADATERVLPSGRVPLLIGGDCTLTLGAVAGAQRVHPDVGLAYFDGDADLATPSTTGSGVMDAMGVAHLLGVADSELARLDRPPPMLADDHLLMLGYNAGDPDSFHADVLAAHGGVTHYPDTVLRVSPGAIARSAVTALAARCSHVIVHFDVDAVDSGDLPLGNFPHYGTGLSLDQATTVLRELCAVPHLAAITLTEVNPSYDPTGTQLTRYIDAVVTAIAASA
jgi:arginase